MRAKEFTPGSQDLIIFDIDDTLMHTTAKIKVVKDGQVIRDLTNQEFNNYQLQPGEEFDFGEFRSAEKFRQESKPIIPMVRKLKSILAHAGNAKVIMLTARADFDDKETFLQTFQDLGIDMSRIHVHRAGNLPGNEPPAYKKAVWVRKYLDTKEYGHVRLYDDSMSNLRVFKDLQKEYPQVDFRAIYVGPGGTTQTIEEASYPGNIGAMEVFKFMQKADSEKKELLKKLIAKKDYSRAWELIQDLTGVKLQGKEFSTENFADGKKPGRKGLAKRSGVNCKASVSTLRNVAKNSSGEKQRMAHWCANMKSGRKK